MKKILALLPVLTFYLTQAQQIKFTSDKFSGFPTSITHERDNYLQINDNEIVFVTRQENKDKTNLVAMDKNCNVLWTISQMEGFVSAAKFGKNTIVLSVNDADKDGSLLIKA